MLSKGSSRFTDTAASAPGDDSGTGALSVNVELAVVSSGVDVKEVELDEMGDDAQTPVATVGTTEAPAADAAEGAAAAADDGSGPVRISNWGGGIDTVNVGDRDLEISVNSSPASSKAAASALEKRWQKQSGARMKGRMKELRQAARAKAGGEDGTTDVDNVGVCAEYGSPPLPLCLHGNTSGFNLGRWVQCESGGT